MNQEPDIKKGKSQKGSALIMVVFTLFLVMLVVSAIYMLARQNLLNVSGDYFSNKAELASRAGIEHAVAKLTADPTYAGVVANGVGGIQENDIPLEDEPDVTYSLHMINNDSPVTNPVTMITAPDGLEISPGIVWVKSTGQLRDRTNSSSTSSSLIKLVGYQRPILKQALFGIESLTVDNSTVQAWNIDGSAQPNRGDLATNATSYNGAPFDTTLTAPTTAGHQRGITVSNSAQIDGSARAGVGSPNAAAVIKTQSLGLINGTPVAQAQLVSEEATQVPRFVLDQDPGISQPSYPHQLMFEDVVLPTPPGGSANVYRYRPIDPAAPNPNPAPTFSIPVSEANNTAVAGGGTPTGVTTTPAYTNRPYLNPGFYDLDPATSPHGTAGPAPPTPGTLRIENVVLRAKRYHFKGDVTFGDNVNVEYVKDPLTLDPNEQPCVIYVDGNITVEPGAHLNWDPVANKALNPRMLQLYTAADKDEDQFLLANQHTLLVGGAAAKTYASFVAAGANMLAVIDNTDFYGGIQCYQVAVQNNSNVFFDVDVYGVPLEGQGLMSVLLNTVSKYSPAAVAAAGPAPGPGPSAPAPTYSSYTTGPGYCTPAIPLLPANGCY